MTAEVVSISGVGVASPGKVSENLIEFLEDCLQRARSGDIVGMTGAICYPSTVGFVQAAGTFSVGFTGGYATIGGLEAVKLSLLMDLGS